MSLWNRKKPTPPETSYNPATDEDSLDRCVRRLNEILDELGPVGQFLEAVGDLRTSAGSPDFEKRLAAELERVRIPGFCGNKLVAESLILMELIAVRVVAMRKLYANSGNTEKLRKLDQIQTLTEAVEPGLREAARNMEEYSSLDGKTQLEALIQRLEPKLHKEGP